jgi:NAD(P)-dependent dehydrogenase (short-subunit alcohol dehydrogenase family)
MASVLITGTSTGIGFETALTLGRAGHKVYATMRDPVRAPKLGQVAAEEGLPIQIRVMDVDSDTSVKTVIDNIYKEEGKLDVLVNNAGIERMGSVEEMPLSEFRAVMETNYFGVIRCVQAVAPHMRTRKSGCIINVSSVAGRISCTPMTPYTASKFALEALTDGLAQEMKTFNVRVALVEPGIIETPMAKRIGEPGANTAYAQQRRFANLFIAALKNPAPPSLVANRIQEIIEGESWQLRYPTGPDAMPFLEWRKSMTDEEWVELYAGDDETWYQRIERDFGMNTRPGH